MRAPVAGGAWTVSDLVAAVVVVLVWEAVVRWQCVGMDVGVPGCARA